MAMNDSLAVGMLEATQLTRAGRVLEATAAIQRALSQQPRSTGRVIEGEFSRVEEPSQRQAANDALEGRAGEFIAGSPVVSAGGAGSRVAGVSRTVAPVRRNRER